MSSAADAKITALYFNAKTDVTISNTLEEMGHPHLAMCLQTRNFTPEGTFQQNCCPKTLQIHGDDFLLDALSVELRYFQVYWAPGLHNIGDYHTKDHQVTHHQNVRDIYLHRGKK